MKHEEILEYLLNLDNLDAKYGFESDPRVPCDTWRQSFEWQVRHVTQEWTILRKKYVLPFNTILKENEETYI